MEKGIKTTPVDRGICAEDILALICAMSEVRPMLQKSGFALRHGIVMILEDQSGSDRLIDFFLAVGANLCKTFARPTKKIRNNGLGIYSYFLYDKEQDVINFLESDEFLPIVITYGAAPDFLKNGPNILIFGADDIKKLQTDQMADEVNSFKKYARNNIDEIAKTLYFFKSSGAFLQYKGESSLYLSLMAVTDILRNFHRYSHNEYDTEHIKIRLRDCIRCICDLSEGYQDDWDILDVVKKLTFTHVDENPQIMFGEMDKIEGRLLEALERRDAILFDSEYYFFPEKILRESCKPLLQSLSFPDVKKELFDQGFLYCNSTKTRNFTTKKLLTNAYGRTFRIRFLKIQKKFFTSPDSLGFEERISENTCLSEILTDVPAQ